MSKIRAGEIGEATSMQEDIIGEIRLERLRQDEKYGEVAPLTPGEYCMILVEELGEATREFLRGNPKHARAELIHCAAVLVKWLESIDSYPPTKPNGRP